METETREKPKPQSNEEEVTKLMIDRPSNFRFHAAYLAYSETWDKTASQEVKTKLNEIMLSLSNKEISYQASTKGWINLEGRVPNTMPILEKG